MNEAVRRAINQIFNQEARKMKFAALVSHVDQIAEIHMPW